MGWEPEFLDTKRCAHRKTGVCPSCSKERLKPGVQSIAHGTKGGRGEIGSLIAKKKRRG